MTLAPGDVVIDGLASRFVADAQGDPWFHVRVGGYATADGVVTHTPDGALRVAARGANGSTGDPAFTSSLAPESANGGIPAANDHPKWLAYMNRLSPAGFPGFDASAGAGLAATVRIAGRTFGTAQHPFGAAVQAVNRPETATFADDRHPRRWWSPTSSSPTGAVIICRAATTC